jgi:hypothetical protein
MTLGESNDVATLNTSSLPTTSSRENFLAVGQNAVRDMSSRQLKNSPFIKYDMDVTTINQPARRIAGNLLNTVSEEQVQLL